nr:hypothetical protein [Salinibacter sp. 10B]
MPPIGPPPGPTVNDLEKLFARRLYKPEGTLARIHVQNPIQLDDYSAPEPDVVLYDPEMPRNRRLLVR